MKGVKIGPLHNMHVSLLLSFGTWSIWLTVYCLFFLNKLLIPVKLLKEKSTFKHLKTVVMKCFAVFTSEREVFSTLKLHYQHLWEISSCSVPTCSTTFTSLLVGLSVLVHSELKS